MKRISLAGKWSFQKAGSDDRMVGKVPGDVYHDLWRNGRIPDPFAGKNESELGWVGESDWVYRKRVELSEDFLGYERKVLSFDGLDTVARITVNGEEIGTANNAHRRYEYRVGEALTAGENEIRVEFRSPVNYGVERKREYGKEFPNDGFQVDQPGREFVRKPQCHFGWDWGPSLPTMGITRDVELIGFTGPRIRYIKTDQEFAGEEVRLEVRAGIEAPKAGTYGVEIEVAGEKKEDELTVNRGRREIVRRLTVEDPDLWWPVGYGEQALSTLTVSIGDGAEGDRAERTIGFREVELVREDDPEGESFYLRVNGTPIFAKGANTIPLDALPGRITEERYADLLESAVEANMNTLRVWGGGTYEADEFYELCDRKGLLVWQDFAFACSPYPADEAFLENVSKEVEYQARRLGTHPSLALWCGDNEIEWLGNRGSLESEETGWEELEEDYEKLNGTIRETINREDPNRTFWPSSPSSDGKAEPNEESVGDTHYWEVWHGGRPFSAYLSVEPRFVSEFGYQSFSSVRLLEEVMDRDELNPTSPKMEYRQRHPNGNVLIIERMTDNFRLPFSFEDFVYLSQIQQGLAMKTAVEGWRRLKPYCMGTLYWQLNDVWPAISWSSLEYGGAWKALHHMARRFYSPVLVSTRERDERLEIWVTSDVDEKLDGAVELTLFDLEGNTLETESFEGKLGKLESRKWKELPLDELAEPGRKSERAARVRFRAGGYESTNYHFFAPFKALDLPRPEVSITTEGNELLVRADRAALFVRLGVEGPEKKGRFSPNYFHLLPDETVSTEFVPSGGKAVGDLDGTEVSIKHLRETY